MNKNLIKQAFKLGYQNGIKKLAWSADIGTFANNINNRANSYYGALNRNNTGGVAGPYVWPDVPAAKMNKDVNTGALDAAREFQAENNAARIATPGSSLFKKVRKNLIRNGKINYRNWNDMNTVPVRTQPDMNGLEKEKLTPEKLRILLDSQNTQARATSAPAQRYEPSGPVETTTLA